MVRSVIGVALLAVAGSALAGAPQWQPIAHVGGSYIRDLKVTTIAAPEIGPAGAIGALTLIFGGLAIVRGRRKP